MSIVSSVYEPLVIPLCLTGDFTGDENEGTGSRPCSSLIPVSFSVAPVRLGPLSVEELWSERKEPCVLGDVSSSKLTFLAHQLLRSLALSGRAWGS